ncbi:hypothetical protein Z043_104967, partial [Scleropages formosus]
MNEGKEISFSGPVPSVPVSPLKEGFTELAADILSVTLPPSDLSQAVTAVMVTASAEQIPALILDAISSPKSYSSKDMPAEIALTEDRGSSESPNPAPQKHASCSKGHVASDKDPFQCFLLFVSIPVNLTGHGTLPQTDRPARLPRAAGPPHTATSQLTSILQKRSKHRLKMNDRVVLNSKQKGVVRFIGPLENSTTDKTTHYPNSCECGAESPEGGTYLTKFWKAKPSVHCSVKEAPCRTVVKWPSLSRSCMLFSRHACFSWVQILITFKSCQLQH